MTFTPEQLKNFIAYQKVQRNGSFNMFDPRARKMTKQSSSEWIFNMEHYSELSEAIKAPKEKK